MTDNNKCWRDPEPISPPEPDYNPNQVPAKIKNYTEQTRTKLYGIDTREAMARAADVAGIISQEANDLATEANEIAHQVNQLAFGKWLEPVDTFDDIATTYPNPEENDRVFVRDTGIVYVFNGTDWQEFMDVSDLPIDEVDQRLSAEIALKANQSDLDDTNDVVQILNDHRFMVVNVKEMFGAVGDDSTDDSAAILAAINYIDSNPWEGLKLLYFPPGNYRVFQDLNFKNSRFWILGANRHNTIIKLDKTAHVNIGDEDNPVNRFRITNIRFMPINVNDSGDYGIKMHRATEGDLDDVSIDSFGNGTALILEERCWTLDFQRARITHNKRGVDFKGNELNAIVFRKGMINNNEIGVYIDCETPNDLVHGLKFIDGIQMETNQEAAFKINCGLIYGMTIDGYFELNHTNNTSQLLIARVDDVGTGNKRFNAQGIEIRGSYIWHRDTTTSPVLIDTRVNSSVFYGESKDVVVRRAKPAAKFVTCIGSGSNFTAKDTRLLDVNNSQIFEHHINQEGGRGKTIDFVSPGGAYFSSTERFRYRLSGADLTVEQNGKVLASGGLGIGNSETASSMGSVVRRMRVYDENGNSLGFVAIYNS
ncbi:glycosyl hydrolase family 28-related protein [Halalkalibacterium halodurans]|uniref:glycosyl hydrolase family 28-related protein n=1 Tax=Halalkalibacterium halodurans TaxID=86665 RepID=UPI002E1FE7FD|nr:glycosyl hydrolase family 28-related protein [Halalkalibacterium halodurans]MED4105501.1 glycosyl hydrolase family 28-related protein [Halalkalibacterium halodurans]MED4109293.1 glycosyl hydrolase family 28-related protein [Halalkalibacterium halodurans]MED4149693.1 glycosyl hydrolase family 28-related protein [Halalkalibacterium halodurans]